MNNSIGTELSECATPKNFILTAKYNDVGEIPTFIRNMQQPCQFIDTLSSNCGNSDESATNRSVNSSGVNKNLKTIDEVAESFIDSRYQDYGDLICWISNEDPKSMKPVVRRKSEIQNRV